jgi:hypothetical protein
MKLLSLLRAGNINMTLSMMFCDTVQPQRYCAPGEVALQLVGYFFFFNVIDYFLTTPNKNLIDYS